MSDPTQHHTGGPPGPVPGWQAPPDLVGTVLADRYKVLGVLGDGGMGRVYLGEHVTLRKKVAVKVLKQEFCHDRTNVERFLQEARAASMIRHENIVDIMDFGQVPGGSVFFVMELLEGSDLSDMLKAGGKLPWLRTRNILLQVVRALRAAHESGIIHRDMKPANVFLINRSSITDYVKVLDFGIAKVDDQALGLTRTGAVFGTAGYMAPEQACGDPVDARTDVYAVGCMMFEMLTGRLPFPGTNFMRVLTQHMNEPPPIPREVAPDADISEEVETIILTALSKRAQDRFPDMAAFERAIAQANGEVATVPPQNRPRTNKGTVVLEDEGPSPFAGMAPGVRPSTKPPTLNPGGTNPDATMMLDGMGGASLGGGANPDATMMLDGMGGASLGGGPKADATVMLDGMGGNALPLSGYAPGQGRADAYGSTVSGAQAQVVESEAPARDKKKLIMMIGGGVLGLLLLIGGIMAVSGGDDDEVATNDEAATPEKQPEEKPPEEPKVDPPATTGETPPDPTTGGAPEADTGVAADSGAAADTGAVAADEGTEAIEEIEEIEEIDVPDPKKPTPTSTVKDALSASDVSKGLKRVKSKVSACKSKGGLPGMPVKVSLMITDGKVSTISAKPPHNSTPVGKCVVEAAGKAKFPKANQPKIVEHTFTL